MAGNADAVGRLLATNALLKGERQLMQRPEKAGEDSAKPSQPNSPSPPISHDSKTTAAVLLKLLDGRLEASEAEAADPRQAAADRRPAANELADPSKRVSARYAEDGLTPGRDAVRQEIPLPPEFARPVPTSAPELQTFLQRLAAFAAAQAGARTGPEAYTARSHHAFESFGAPLLAAVVIAMLLWLGAMLSGWLPG